MTSRLIAGTATRVVLDVPGGQIAALQAGPIPAEPVLLVPGYTGSKEDFATILDPLAEAGYRVTSIDMRGQYESPGHGEAANYSVETLGDDLRAVAAQLGDRVHLVGHSFGGLVARAAVIGKPAGFASLTLLGSGPAGLDGGRRARMEMLRPVLAKYGIAAVYDAMEALSAAEPGYVAPPAEIAAFLRLRFLAGDPAMLLGMGDALINEPDRVDELASVDVPVLVMCGIGDDAWTPEVQTHMAERLGAPYVEVPNSMHSPAVENPGFTAEALVTFWRSVR
jgi:pimeloyl-ACP methyl ester carboxylesterase